MTPPLIAWAAVAPDGTMYFGPPYATGMICKKETDVWAAITNRDKEHDYLKERAFRKGWRVVRVRIEAVEEVE